MEKPKQENNGAMILSLKILAKVVAKLVVIAPTKPLTCDGQHRENHPMMYHQKPVKDNLNLRDGRTVAYDGDSQSHQVYQQGHRPYLGKHRR
jgi:hypothetical protein